MDVIEREDAYVLRADVPGLSRDKLQIDLHDRVLTIVGERAAEERGVGRHERAHGAFRRSLTLPQVVDAEGITAELTDGVLTVTVPKPVAQQPRRIEVRAASPAIEAAPQETEAPQAA